MLTTAQNKPKIVPSPPKHTRVREAVKQFVGQADRSQNLFADVLLDLVERVEKLEAQGETVN